jgi:hypothetical protein
MDSIPLLQAYFTQLYNDFTNDLNLTTKGETLPELHSVSCTPHRISEELQRIGLDPRYRFYLAERLDKVLYNMVPRAESGN